MHGEFSTLTTLRLVLMILNTIVVCGLPEEALASAEDLQDSVLRIKELVEWVTSSWELFFRGVVLMHGFEGTYLGDASSSRTQTAWNVRSATICLRSGKRRY